MYARALLLLLALAAQHLPAAGAPLLPSFTYPLQDGQETLIVTRSVWLDGNSVRNASAPSAEACIKACRLDGACEWSNWCPVASGCNDGIGPLVYQGCRMLSGKSPGGNCTLSPPVVGRLEGEAQDTGGFAVQAPPIRPPGYIARPGQEIVGFDFACPGSVLDDMCALPSGLGAVLVCERLAECQAVVVYPQGLDGCSSELGVLKKSRATTTNARMAPRALLLELAEPVKLVRIGSGQLAGWLCWLGFSWLGCSVRLCHLSCLTVALRAAASQPGCRPSGAIAV
jgi:hypothetical protein